MVGGARNTTNSGIIIPVSDFAKLLTLVARVVTASNYQHFQSTKAIAASPYQVPTGKTFIGIGWYLRTSAGAEYGMGYGTATFTNDQVGAPTGAIYYGAGTNNGFATAAAEDNIFYPLPVQFPALSFPFFRSDSNGTNIKIVGIEV